MPIFTVKKNYHNSVFSVLCTVLGMSHVSVLCIVLGMSHAKLGLSYSFFVLIVGKRGSNGRGVVLDSPLSKSHASQNAVPS